MKVFKPSVQVSKLALTFIVQYLKITDNAEFSRTTLHKIHARKTDDESCWVLEATDGHRLVTNMVDKTEIEHNLGVNSELQFLDMFADDFKLLLKKHKNSGDTCMIDVSEFASKCLKDEFPDLKMVMPKAEMLQWSVSFNAEYLEEMLKAMRDHKRQTAVTLKFSGDKNPIVVTCGGSSYGVLMPIAR